MANQNDLDAAYMGTAILHSRLSVARRKKVGACAVTQSGISLTGFNGTPPKADNNCEIEIENSDGTITLVTKPDVIHAELNCVLKAASEGVSLRGATVYVTLAPCLHCSAVLRSLQISRLVYLENYRDDSGVRDLIKHGIRVDHRPDLNLTLL